MAAIAIIPARGGSKRIPRKNIREFMGQPMLAYAISAAQASAVFDEVMVSTDDAEIACVAKKFNATVPFMRSDQASTDMAIIADVFREVLARYADEGKTFEIAACIYPCVPLLEGQHLAEAYATFSQSGASALLPVVRYGQPIQRALRQNARGFIEFREPEYALTRTQDLEPMFHDAGMFFFVRVADFMRNGQVIMPQTIPYEVPEEIAQDIDNLQDWLIAERKYRMARNG